LTAPTGGGAGIELVGGTMNEHKSLAGRAAARLLIGLLGALCLAVPPVLAVNRDGPEAKNEAAVAKKVERAQGAAYRSAAIRHFQEEAAEYAELHARQLAKLELRGSDTPESPATQRALAQAISTHRVKAKPGDIFRPEIQPLLRRLIAEQLEGPESLAARKAVVEGNPGQEEDSIPVAVRVNGEYPSGAPRSTVPPSLLLTLPPLPKALEYRFVGRDLILLDSTAGLIVDVLPNAAPGIPAK
jgi:hypothetical protein